MDTEDSAGSEKTTTEEPKNTLTVPSGITKIGASQYMLIPNILLDNYSWISDFSGNEYDAFVDDTSKTIFFRLKKYKKR